MLFKALKYALTISQIHKKRSGETDKEGKEKENEKNHQNG